MFYYNFLRVITWLNFFCRKVFFPVRVSLWRLLPFFESNCAIERHDAEKGFWESEMFFVSQEYRPHWITYRWMLIKANRPSWYPIQVGIKTERVPAATDWLPFTGYEFLLSIFRERVDRRVRFYDDVSLQNSRGRVRQTVGTGHRDNRNRRHDRASLSLHLECVRLEYGQNAETVQTETGRYQSGIEGLRFRV